MPAKPEGRSLVEKLSSIPLLAELDEATLEDLARMAVWREYGPGEAVFSEGDRALGLYIVESGWVKAVRTSPQGRELVLQFIGPSEPFNTVGVFANLPSPATAVALEPTGVWLLPRERVTRLLRERPAFAERVVENMAGRMVHLVGLVSDLSLRPVTGRLARLLLDRAEHDVVRRPRWFTVAELAARLGTVPDVVQRALGKLAGDGVIEVSRREIRIRDRAALEDLSG